MYISINDLEILIAPIKEYQLHYYNAIEAQNKICMLTGMTLLDNPDTPVNKLKEDFDNLSADIALYKFQFDKSKQRLVEYVNKISIDR